LWTREGALFHVRFVALKGDVAIETAVVNSIPQEMAFDRIVRYGYFVAEDFGQGA
jgi:hypothetical protein